MDKLQINVYPDLATELTALETGQLDVTDWPVPRARMDSFLSNPNIVVSPRERMSNVVGIEFNHGYRVWGCDFQRGNSECGQELRQGIAHLVDKFNFISTTLPESAEKVDCFSPPVQNIPCDGPQNGSVPAWNVCTWDTNPAHRSCLGAYDMASENPAISGVQTGSPDFCAAADHFLDGFKKAGVKGITKDSRTCVLQNTQGLGSVNIAVIWDIPELQRLGDTLWDSINRLMGRPSVNLCRTDTELAAEFSFLGPTSGNLVCDNVGITSEWHMATAEWMIPRSNIDQLYLFYNSKHATNNYLNPEFDRWTSLLEFNSTWEGARLSARSGEYVRGSRVINLPIWSGFNSFSYLNGWNTGMMIEKGVGIPNRWTSINAWRSNPAIAGALRWGFSQGTRTLNIFHASSFWESYILGEVYDSLLVANPSHPTQLVGWLANSWRFMTPSELGYSPPVGTVQTMRVFLQEEVYWHDGERLDPADVKFSILSYRDVPGNSLQRLVSSVIDIKVIPGGVDIYLNARSPFHDYNIGSLPIIPQHIWALRNPDGTLSMTADPDKTSLFFDPIWNYALIGSGPYVCRDISTGVRGGRCTSSGNSILSPYDSVLLQRYGLGSTHSILDQYFRSSKRLREWIWADENSDGIVDFAEISHMDYCFEKPATGGCAHWDMVVPVLDGSGTNVGCAGRDSAGGPIGCVGGNGNGIVDSSEFSHLMLIFSGTDTISFGTTWTWPQLTWTDNVGIQTFPPTLHEGQFITYP